MSTNSFTDALIGLAREHKQKERQSITMGKRAVKLSKPKLAERFPPPTLGHEVTQLLIGSGYFEKASAEVFGDALEALLQNSTPTRKTT